MDEATIKGEASAALNDLELDATVSGVTHSGKNWCIQFSGDYGQFCDSFQNQFEHDNSLRVIREKIKKHLLGQITQLRNKGGLKSRVKGFDESEGRERNVTELFQEAITQTTRAVGEAIDRTLGVTGATIKSAGDVVETINARTNSMLAPARSSEPARAAARSTARKSASPKSATKAKRSGTKKKAAAKTTRAGRAKKAGSQQKRSRKG